jgi:hypothetical protein
MISIINSSNNILLNGGYAGIGSYLLLHYLINHYSLLSDVQMKSWVWKALEIVNCFAFLKCKLTVVIRAC